MEEKRRNARSEKPCAGAGLEKEQEAGAAERSVVAPGCQLTLGRKVRLCFVSGEVGWRGVNYGLLCSYLCVFVCVRVCGHLWRLEAKVRCLPLSLSTLDFETEPGVPPRG